MHACTLLAKLFVPLLPQPDYQRKFQKIFFGDIRVADISKISSLFDEGVDPNIYNKVKFLQLCNVIISIILTYRAVSIPYGELLTTTGVTSWSS
jgi:ferredoxin-fold anticodon binding domain-containing protein